MIIIVNININIYIYIYIEREREMYILTELNNYMFLLLITLFVYCFDAVFFRICLFSDLDTVNLHTKNSRTKNL